MTESIKRLIIIYLLFSLLKFSYLRAERWSGQLDRGPWHAQLVNVNIVKQTAINLSSKSNTRHPNKPISDEISTTTHFEGVTVWTVEGGDIIQL